MVRAGSIVITFKEEGKELVSIFVFDGIPGVETIIEGDTFGARVSFEHWYSNEFGKKVAEFFPKEKLLRFTSFTSAEVMITIISMTSLNYDLEKVDISGGIDCELTTEELSKIQKITNALGIELVPEPKEVRINGKIYLCIEIEDNQVHITKDLHKVLNTWSCELDKEDLIELVDSLNGEIIEKC